MAKTLEEIAEEIVTGMDMATLRKAAKIAVQISIKVFYNAYLQTRKDEEDGKG